MTRVQAEAEDGSIVLRIEEPRMKELENGTLVPYIVLTMDDALDFALAVAEIAAEHLDEDDL